MSRRFWIVEVARGVLGWITCGIGITLLGGVGWPLLAHGKYISPAHGPEVLHRASLLVILTLGFGSVWFGFGAFSRLADAALDALVERIRAAAERP